MPSAQVIDLNPVARTELTPLEKTLSGFSNRKRENELDVQDTDALREIYDKHKNDGQNLEATLREIQTRPGISPTTRVNSKERI